MWEDAKPGGTFQGEPFRQGIAMVETRAGERKKSGDQQHYPEGDGEPQNRLVATS